MFSMSQPTGDVWLVIPYMSLSWGEEPELDLEIQESPAYRWRSKTWDWEDHHKKKGVKERSKRI